MKPAAPVTRQSTPIHPISGSSDFYSKSTADLGARTPRRKLKVALVGGSDVAQRLELVSRMGQDFNLCVFGPDDSAGPMFAGVGADYRFYPMTRGVSPWKDLVTIAALRRHFRSIRPDIVHTFDSKPCALGRLAAWLAGVPVIIGTQPGMGSLYASNSRRIMLTRWVYERVQKLACKLSDLTILQNAEDVGDFVSRGITAPSKTAIVRGSGVNTETFRPGRLSGEEADRVRASLGIGTGAMVVTMVSRIMRTKGVLEYASAAKQASQTHVDLHFLLVGADDRDSPDRLTTKELDVVTRSVRCLGRRSDVADLLSITDVFVLPSFSMEGIPRALLEAAASGLASITTDTRGCRDVVLDAVSGILVPPRDSAALWRAILSLLEDPVLRLSLGQEARKRALEEFDLTIISDRIKGVYVELTGHVRVRRRWGAEASGPGATS